MICPDSTRHRLPGLAETGSLFRSKIPVTMLKMTAQGAAVAAGDMLMRRFQGKQTPLRLEDHDVKLEVDRFAEKIVTAAVRKAFPDHGILSEESGLRAGSSPYLWIADPLDGTVNYYQQIPHFCVSVACYYRREDVRPTRLADLGHPLVGVIHAPASGNLFTGALGEGAFCNGVPIRAWGGSSLHEALIAMSFGSGQAVMERMERISSALIRSVRKVRIFGATGLDLAHVACGKSSGLVQGAVRSWDFAAGRVILEQSGGVFSARPIDEDSWEIIAGAPGIFHELKSLISETS